MTVKIEFDTAAYVRSHGKEPRGFGSWAFGLKRNADVLGNDVLWSPSMSLGDAKKWAKREIAKRFGDDAEGTLHVLP